MKDNQEALDSLNQMTGDILDGYIDAQSIEIHHRKIERALKSNQKCSEWKPIETAPENGQAIIGYSPAYKGVMICAINGRSHSWWSPGLGHMPADHPMYPTRWIPLPEPPE